MPDQEIRKLQAETARAYAVAERLASELDNTVAELLRHVGTRKAEQSGTVTQRTRTATNRSKT